MKPETGTYPVYYTNYISQVREENVTDALKNNLAEVKLLLQSLSPAKADYAYAPGKWTIKQLVNHVMDAERIFAYRALCFARNEKQTLPAFEEDDYVAASLAEVELRSLTELLNEFEHLRTANILMFASFTSESLLKKGATPAGQATVLSIGFTIAGHCNHHLKVIREKYL